MMDLSTKEWVGHVLKHPIEGYEDMRWKKAGNMKVALLIVFLWFLGSIAYARLWGFQFGNMPDRLFSIVPFLLQSFGYFFAWVVGNWSICTLFDGEGKMRNICIYSAYALIPYVAQLYINTLLSHILIQDEVIFIQLINWIGTGWTVVLLFQAIRAVHQYSIMKTIGAILATLFAMIVMLFLLVLLLSLVQQVYIFAYTIYTEVLYRVRV